VWAKRRPFLLWWMQSHSYRLLWAGCGWKSSVEELTVIRKGISAWYNLSILYHYVSTLVFMEFYFTYMHLKLPVWWIPNGYWINICKQRRKGRCLLILRRGLTITTSISSSVTK
jgi:hypothetical protein